MRRSSVVMLVVLAGCFARVTVPPPKLDGTAASREKAMQELSPVSYVAQETYLERGPGTPEVRNVLVDLDGIKLGNGQMVEDPRDLIPLVPGTRTAALAKEWGGKRQRWDAHLWAALATFTLGGVGMFTLPGLSGDPRVASSLFLGSLITAVLGPAINILIPGVFVGKIERIRIEAFAQYEDDLRSSLQPPPVPTP
jgi:hypothetical protein